MKNTVQSMFRKFVNSVTGLEFTSGVAIVVAVSCLLYIITSYFNTSEYTFSLGSSVFLNGHVHKLFFYSFYNKDAMQLILSAGVLVSFTSGLEKGVGTVRFLYLLLLLSVWTGLLHVLLEILLFPHDSRSSVSGLIPTSLSMLGMITIRSPMTKAFLMGISVPTASFPWFILLIITLFIPNTVLLCNVLAIVTGEIYGMGWLSVFEMSESSASVLEKKMPFRLLRRMVGVKFVPSSAEERRKVFYTKCNPPPGSYPVQAYAPAPPQAVGDQPNTFDGWPQSSYMQEQHVFPSPFPAHGHGHSHGHGHGHTYSHIHAHTHTHAHGQFFSQGYSNEGYSQGRDMWTPMAASNQVGLGPLMNMAGQFTAQLPQPAVPVSSQMSKPDSEPVSSLAAHGPAVSALH